MCSSARRHVPLEGKASLSVGLISLGCAKNRVDSEIMLRSILRAGLTLAKTPETGDIVLVNTCAFIADAKRESLDAILSAIDRKARGLCRIVAVVGCMPQRYQRSLRRELPEVDVFAGLDQVPYIGSILAKAAKDGRAQYKIHSTARAVLNPPHDRPLLCQSPYAYIRIADGCNHRCAFCAIPLIRGRHRSRRPDAIMRECEALLERGTKELNLISQDVFDYGRDLAGNPLLSTLLRRLDRLGGQFWIRLLYGHPASLNDELLDAIGECNHVCRYLDIPIQHAHPAILRAMGRNCGPKELPRLFAEIRRKLPDMTLRTTCIAGFPGETEKRFQCLLQLLREIRFDHVGVFVFSPEEGTPASVMPHQVPLHLARKRCSELLAVQRQIINAHATLLCGAETVALLEQQASSSSWLARSQRHAPEVDGTIRVKGLPALSGTGDFMRIRLAKQAGCNFTAVAVRDDKDLVPGLARSRGRIKHQQAF